MTGIACVGAVLVSALAGLVSHGVLRPLLEARGIVPWTVKDTLGSTPLILSGSALIGGALASGVALVAQRCAAGWPVGLCVLTAAVGVVTVLLGLNAVRKVV